MMRVLILVSFSLLASTRNLGATEAACEIEVDGESIPRDLVDALQAYYGFEFEGDWDSAYAYRSPSFQHAVSKDWYSEKMSQYNAGWKTLSCSVVNASKDSESFVFDMVFVENVPKDSNLGRMLGGEEESVFKDTSEWQRIGGRWFCRYCGIRYRLRLNVPLGEGMKSGS